VNNRNSHAWAEKTNPIKDLREGARLGAHAMCQKIRQIQQMWTLAERITVRLASPTTAA
jgi:hypothetical protein